MMSNTDFQLTSSLEEGINQAIRKPETQIKYRGIFHRFVPGKKQGRIDCYLLCWK